MRYSVFTLFFLLLHLPVIAQQPPGRLHVSPDGRSLLHADGRPFFWLGDTGWELFHRLDAPEIKDYLDNRAAKGFTVIQAVVLAEMEGLTQPNRYGEVPFVNNDPAKPNERYFSLVDSTAKWAAARGMYLGLLPTWGDKVTQLWGAGPVVFDSTKAYAYGRWLAARYKRQQNIIWILGGDRPAQNDKSDWRPVWRGLAQGIESILGKAALITYHPSGGSSSSQWLHREAWLDFNMFQSGHGNGHDVAVWDFVKKDRSLSPAKPTLDAEPNYEDHPVSPWPKWNVDNGYFRDYDVRKQLYRSVFAGACGVTYGHHAVWQFMSERVAAINYPDRGWRNALDRPGAFHAGILAKFMQQLALKERIPDLSFINISQNTSATHAEAFRNGNGSVAAAYLPVGGDVEIVPGVLPAASYRLSWFDPRKGVWREGGWLKKERMKATAPGSGPGNDWVLVLRAGGQ
ncbi:DUF4038 domain-containing protein [Chitinophaga sp.]|uniref:apiosidase-like domain-containing protein n=1 Tax=Chitinophaga sp. TaxID=1869181 RepID=UPI002623DEB1|nr:DUF4038 domain-containing protein [uncultured Chitinophaga sp.]